MGLAGHDRVWWSRVLLAVLSFGFAIAAGAGLLAAGMAIDPEDEVPRAWVIVPGLVALVGFVAAGLGGLAARIGSAALGLVTAVGGLWLLVEGFSHGLLNVRAMIQFGLLMVLAVVIGLAAVFVAIGSPASARPAKARQP